MGTCSSVTFRHHMAPPLRLPKVTRQITIIPACLLKNSLELPQQHKKLNDIVWPRRHALYKYPLSVPLKALNWTLRLLRFILGPAAVNTRFHHVRGVINSEQRCYTALFPPILYRIRKVRKWEACVNETSAKIPLWSLLSVPVVFMLLPDEESACQSLGRGKKHG